MVHRTRCLGPGSWCLRVDSRHRVTFPKALLLEMGWEVGDTLLWTLMEDGPIQVSSLNLELRQKLAELNELRGIQGEAFRVESLAEEISALVERIYPLKSPISMDTSGLPDSSGAPALIEPQGAQSPHRIDAILAWVEGRKAAHLVRKQHRQSKKSGGR